MTGFRREIKVRPAYDYRHDPKDGRGAHGAEIQLILTGDEGAITAAIMTGWVMRPLKASGSFSLASRMSKPGVDLPLADCYPSAGLVSAHSALRRENYLDGDQECDLLPGGRCYGDGSYTAGDVILAALIEKGSDGAFAELEGYYAAWITERTPEVSA